MHLIVVLIQYGFSQKLKHNLASVREITGLTVAKTPDLPNVLFFK